MEITSHAPTETRAKPPQSTIRVDRQAVVETVGDVAPMKEVEELETSVHPTMR